VAASTTLYTDPSAAATDWLIPTSPSPCRVCKRCAAAVTTDTQSNAVESNAVVQRLAWHAVA